MIPAEYRMDVGVYLERGKVASGFDKENHLAQVEMG